MKQLSAQVVRVTCFIFSPAIKKPLAGRLKCLLISKWFLRCFSPHNELLINLELFVNQHTQHAALIASYRKLHADAKEKLTAAVAAISKGPNVARESGKVAIQAKRRRDVVAAKLTRAGLLIPS